jgi:hypothetical protein
MLTKSGHEYEKRGLYLFPRPIATDGGGRLHTGDRFVNLDDDNLSKLYNVAVECDSLSTRDRQFPRYTGRGHDAG